MSYEQYDCEIVLRYGVQVVGWPSGIPFTNPSKILSVTDLITLRDVWHAKICRWVRLSSLEMTRFKKELEAREMAGGKKVRKKRSDAGKKRTRGRATKEKVGEGEEGEEEDDNDDNKEDEDLSPKRRWTYKSKEVISESDEK